MTTKTMSAASTVALVLASAAAGGTDFGDMVSLRGFGTFGIVHSSEDRADFVGSVFQPDGAGYSRDWDMRPDTLLAGQLSLKFNDKFSAVVQAVAQHQYDKTFTPNIEWANVKYQVTPELALRAGRIVLPSFLVSESRFVGFANPWVRPPQEVYFVSAITSNDGVDATYSFATGRLKNTVQGFWGTTDADLPSGSVKADPSWGVNYTAELGELKLRAGYIATKADLKVASLNPLFAGLNGLGSVFSTFGLQAQASQAFGLAKKYQEKDLDLTTYSVGANYDAGTYFVMVEGALFNGDGFLSDTKSAYVTVGYRIKSVTPYATISTVKADIDFEPGVTTAGLPAALAAGAAGLNAGLNATLNQFTGSQSDASAGIRWDFKSSAALKVQYDHIDLGNGSAGKLVNPQPNYVPGGNVELFSISVDYIF